LFVAGQRAQHPQRNRPQVQMRGVRQQKDKHHHRTGYEPEADSTGLGTFMILDHIERAQALDLPYVYLGYWVDGSDKMAYKARFQPQEHLTSKGWITVPPS
ncbi:MAG: hypothetical protein AAF580_12485, partial [Pseudomonadota bacterium]